MNDRPRRPGASRFGLLGESVKMGLEVIRSHRLRSALLVLGVAIGVAALMAMVAILSGLGEKIAADIANTDRVVIYVTRYDIFVGGSYEDFAARPDIVPDDAAALGRLCPSVDRAEYYIETGGRMTLLHYRGRRTRPVAVIGTGPHFHTFYSIPLAEGRYFTESDIDHRRRVCVVAAGPARDLFSDVDPVGKRLRLGENLYEVVGSFAERRSLAGEMGENFIAIPYSTFLKDWKEERDTGYAMLTVNEGVRAETAMDEARAVMRVRRGLKPGEPDNFAVFSADAVQELVDRITGPIALALVIISSIGLLVGGIGVMNIMLVSVTERTREIGVRRAVGARRRDILLEVLIESGTLTGIGGVLGLILGGGGAAAIAALTRFPVVIRPEMVAIAVLFSVAIGVFFGLYPANRAARVDPVVALRLE